MKTHSSMLHVRMDTEMKRKATTALAAMGMTASQAVRLSADAPASKGGLRIEGQMGESP